MTGFALCMACGVRADSVDEFRAIHPERNCPQVGMAAAGGSPSKRPSSRPAAAIRAGGTSAPESYPRMRLVERHASSPDAPTGPTPSPE